MARSTENNTTFFNVNLYSGTLFEASEDNGLNFEDRSAGLPIGSYNSFRMHLNPVDASNLIIFADSADKYYETKDLGLSWVEWSQNTEYYPSVRSVDNAIYREDDELIERSEDFGNTWVFHTRLLTGGSFHSNSDFIYTNNHREERVTKQE